MRARAPGMKEWEGGSSGNERATSSVGHLASSNVKLVDRTGSLGVNDALRKITGDRGAFALGRQAVAARPRRDHLHLLPASSTPAPWSNGSTPGPWTSQRARPRARRTAPRRRTECGRYRSADGTPPQHDRHAVAPCRRGAARSARAIHELVAKKGQWVFDLERLHRQIRGVVVWTCTPSRPSFVGRAPKPPPIVSR